MSFWTWLKGIFMPMDVEYPIMKIAGVSVVFRSSDQSYSWTAGAMIDGDGSGGNAAHDPDFQPDTALHVNGRALDAEIEPYIVVPPELRDGLPGVVLGCHALVTHTLTGKQAVAVVGDIGPRRKLGEMSMRLAELLGIPADPITGGEPLKVIKYRIYPGIPAVVNGVQYPLVAA